MNAPSKPVLVLYATREGHTRRIAEHVAATVRGRGLTADVLDAGRLPAGFELGAYACAIVAGSVHMQRHERELVAFVKAHKAALERMPAAFLSVSLAEATAENPRTPPEMRGKAAEEVMTVIHEFFGETGWHPDRVWPVAGALVYSEYNILERFVMRLIAKRAGGDTNTSADYEYTDWIALDRFVAALLREQRSIIPPPEHRASPAVESN